ncbi:MAG: hypothetical protein WB762_21760 [Candidatus Sulfotelmatobacter sp.]
MRIVRWGALGFVIACGVCVSQAQAPAQAKKKQLLVIGKEKGYRHGRHIGIEKNDSGGLTVGL